MVDNPSVQDGPTWDRLPVNVRNQAPRQMTANNESRLIHREPLATVNGSVAFGISTYTINPGLANIFPWLSAQASGYESYKFNSLTVEYRFTTNEFVGIGRVIIAPDYDASDSPPSSAVEAEQMADSVMGAVAKNWNCILRPRGIGILGPKRYTRTGTLDPNEDIKTYDIAQVHVVTQGQTDAAEIGQLWLNYDITLCEPQPISVGSILAAGYEYNTNGTGCTTTNLLGTGTVADGAISVSHVNNLITLTGLVVGQTYNLFLHIIAAVITTAPSVTLNTGLDQVNNPDQLYTLNGGTTVAWGVRYAKAVSNVATITLGGITVLTTPSYAVFSVSGSIQHET